MCNDQKLVNSHENFKNFLMAQNAYDKFCFNLLETHGTTFEDLSTNKSFKSMIDYSFTWDETEEGNDYWSELNVKWDSAINNGMLFNCRCESIW